MSTTIRRHSAAIVCRHPLPTTMTQKQNHSISPRAYWTIKILKLCHVAVARLSSCHWEGESLSLTPPTPNPFPSVRKRNDCDRKFEAKLEMYRLHRILMGKKTVGIWWKSINYINSCMSWGFLFAFAWDKRLNYDAAEGCDDETRDKAGRRRRNTKSFQFKQ